LDLAIKPGFSYWVIAAYGWYACLGCRDIFLSVQTTVFFLLFAFESLAVLSGTLENHSRRYLAAFEIHCVAAMGMLTVPGYVVVSASAAIDHGSHI
jgi:hypothetical protein